MKQRAMDSLATSICAYLSSRNNDIAGYWGIGKLCEAASRKRKQRLNFEIRPGEPIVIDGLEITWSRPVTAKLVKLNLDRIDGQISFLPDGRYPDSAARYACTLAIAIRQDTRIGLGVGYIQCWPHDPRRESRSGRRWPNANSIEQ